MNKHIFDNQQIDKSHASHVGNIYIGDCQQGSRGNRVFIPITDDIIYNHPEQIEGPLVPYFAGMECQNWLSIELNPEDTIPAKQ